MKTTLDCLPCFLKQALHTARLTSAPPDVQKKIMEQALDFLHRVNFSASPPENAVALYEMIAMTSNCSDPFRALKQQSNRFALKLKSLARKQIEESAHPLYSALLFSMAGNIIDYGSMHHFDMEQTIRKALTIEPAINDFPSFAADLARAKSILYLGDNSGELVFDSLVIEKLGKNITFVVKERPIINDALREDAEFCGIDTLCRVISNGTGCPGTPLAACSEEFQKLFTKADLIISKGQGNFETLSETKAPLYFLLTVKCPVVQEHIRQISGRGAEIGRTVLLGMRND